MLFFVTARLVFGLVFLAGAVAHWPVPWYLPLERRWVFARQVQTLGMDWYGRSVFSLAAGTLAGAVLWALAGHPRLARTFARPAVVRDIAHLGALMLVSDVAFYVLSMLTRHVTPSPLPSWYCPQ